jgi:hypothetical protein
MKLSRHLAIVLIPLLLASARADDKPDLQTILDAWKAREKKVESFDFRWWSKHHESHGESLPAANNLAQGNAIPRPENYSIWHYRFVVDSRNRYFYEEVGHSWIPKKGDFVPTHTVVLFDSKSYKTLSDKGHFDCPVLTVKEYTAGRPVPRSTWADPIKFEFRPLSLAMGMFGANNLTLANQTEIIDNHRVCVLSDEYRTVWVDPAKDYVPVRWAATSGDLRAEISYQSDESVGWVPHSWTIRRLPDSETATVTRFAINKPIADSEFELDLSGGAILENSSDGGITRSIIYPDGKQRPLKPGEFDGHNFQDLLKTEPDSK